MEATKTFKPTGYAKIPVGLPGVFLHEEVKVVAEQDELHYIVETKDSRRFAINKFNYARKIEVKYYE